MIQKILNHHRIAFSNANQMGGIALEYVLVSIFGLVVSVAAIGFVVNAVDSKLEGLEQQLGLDFDLDSLNPFNSGGD